MSKNKGKRVLLINPPADRGVKMVREGRCMQRQGAWTAVWAPVSLALIGAVLRERGFEPRLVDCIVEEVDMDGVARIAREFKPCAAILNTATPSIESDLSTASVIKRESPGCAVAAFGIHVTALPRESMEMNAELDAVIRGEPEITALEFAEVAASGADFTGVKGLSWSKGGKIHDNPDREPVGNLDTLPFPAWDLVKREKYVMPLTDRKFLLIATGRGCPHKCAFCADTTFYGRKLRLRSPGRIADEMEWVKREFGIQEFLFWTETFTVDYKFADAVADELARREEKFRWVCNSRVDGVDEALVRKFKAAGCWMIGFGFESGDQGMLDRMGKGATVSQAREAVRLCRKHGIEATGHFVLGYPGETEATQARTLALARELDLDFAQFYCAVPFPGSPLYDRALANNWIKKKDWRLFEQNVSVLGVNGFGPEDVERWRRRAYIGFYASPRRAVKILRRVRSAGDVAGIARGLRDFLGWI